MRKNQGNYIDTSKQYKPYYFKLRDKGSFWCKEGYMKAYNRYSNCKIIAECDSYIYGNEFIWYKCEHLGLLDIDLLMMIILKGKKVI